MSRLGSIGVLGASLALAACATHAPLRLPESPAPRPAVAPPAPTVAPRPLRLPPYSPPVKCVPETLGPPPSYPDGDAALRAAGGAADRYQLLAAGRILREQRLQKLEEVIRRCRNAGR